MTTSPPCKDLSTFPDEVWNEAIITELAAAGLRPTTIHKAEHTRTVNIGDWTLSRNKTAWFLWCKVPLATAEVIVANKECANGAIPMRWQSSVNDTPNPSEIHTLTRLAEFTLWIEGDNTLIHIETGRLDHYKEALIHNSTHSLARKIRFVDDPEAEGEPFIMNYTFFTIDALTKFFTVVKRHRLLPSETFLT